jgi:hypothetical protein
MMLSMIDGRDSQSAAIQRTTGTGRALDSPQQQRQQPNERTQQTNERRQQTQQY